MTQFATPSELVLAARGNSHASRILAGISLAGVVAILSIVAIHFAGDSTVLLLSVAVVAVGGAILYVWQSPTHGLLLLVLSLPLVSVGVIEVGWSVRLSQVCVVLIGSIGLIAARSHIGTIPLRGWIAVYIASLILSAVWAYLQPAQAGIALVSEVSQRASSLRPAVQLLTTLMSLAVLAIVALTIGHDERNLNAAMKTWLAITAVVCLYGLYQPLAVAWNLPLADITWSLNLMDSATIDYGQVRHYSGIVTSFAPRSTFAESLHLGAYLAGVFPVCLAGWLGRRHLPRAWQGWWWRCLVLLVGLTLLLTFSRSSWLAAGLGSFVVLVSLRRVRLWVVAFSGAALLFLVFWAFTRLSIFDSTFTSLELIANRLSIEQLVTDPRVVYILTLAQTATDHPFLGVGLGNYALIGSAELGLDTILSAHSVWAAHWVEGGVVGLAVLLAFAAAFWIRLRRHLKRMRQFSSPWTVPLIGLSASIVAMSAQYLTWGDRFDPYFWFVVALASCVGTIGIRWASPQKIGHKSGARSQAGWS